MNITALIDKLLLGGFLKGYRTQLIAAGLAINIAIQYLGGDIGFVEFAKQFWEQAAIVVGLLTASFSGNDTGTVFKSPTPPAA